jgi:hypothetical protein
VTVKLGIGMAETPVGITQPASARSTNGIASHAAMHNREIFGGFIFRFLLLPLIRIATIRFLCQPSNSFDGHGQQPRYT